MKFESINHYMLSVAPEVRPMLETLHQAIKEAAPGAQEIISYNMPSFKQGRVLVYYAINKEHIGFYPTSGPIVVFKDELIKYKTSKGAIQFPLTQKIPVALVKKIVKYRVKEEQERVKAKKK